MPLLDFQLLVLDKVIKPLPELIHQLSNRMMVKLQVRVYRYELSLVSI